MCEICFCYDMCGVSSLSLPSSPTHPLTHLFWIELGVSRLAWQMHFPSGLIFLGSILHFFGFVCMYAYICRTLQSVLAVIPQKWFSLSFETRYLTGHWLSDYPRLAKEHQGPHQSWDYRCVPLLPAFLRGAAG